MNKLKTWFVSTVLKWFPKERIAAMMLENLLNHSNTRARASVALKVAERILESSRALVVALRKLLAVEVTPTTIHELNESTARIALEAWAAGEPTPPEARGLKEHRDEAT